MFIPVIYPVTCNTNHVGPGSTFVAIKGHKEDGATYIPKAINRGATTIIVDKSYIPKDIPAHIQIIFVDDTRKALAAYAAQALNNPAQKLKFIGITGTAGKTTTTYLVDHLLNQAGYKTALIGSIKNKIGDKEEESTLTSPAADYIQMFLAECVKEKIDYVIMEISSHSIALSRIHGIEFDAVGFTNLSPEHMDFHPSMEHYFQTKAALFKQLKQNGIAVINIDNPWGKKAVEYFDENGLKQKVIAFGFEQQETSESQTQHHIFYLEEACRPFPPAPPLCPALVGAYNNYNVCMAKLICSELGVTSNIITQALATFAGVPGRLQMHTLKNGAKAFVDFAHKPGAFDEVLKTLRPLTSHLIVIFGCGGNRDTTKRPVMGKLAADYADLIIVTDDNPRDEDRQAIANEIVAGIPKEKMTSVIVELDRKKAITLATQNAQPHSIIALLGKGHENYYLIKGEKHHFDDLEEVKRF